MNDTNGAKEDFTHALEDNPASIHTWLKMANIHLDHSNIEESLDCFEKALSYDSKDADFYFHRGQGRVPIPNSEWDLNGSHSPICSQPARQGVGRLRSFSGTRQQLRLQSHSAGRRPLQGWRGNEEHGRVPQNYETLPSTQRTSELLVGLILI
jgi:tetratricopeptide (TPR) repeat protein